jgi:hypothetical protein
VAADNSVSQVVILDTLGRQVETFGQLGEGPGDLNLRNMAGGTNRLALLDGGSIVVTDVRHTKVFSREGLLRQWIKVDSLSTLDRFDMQVFPLGRTSFIATRTGKQHGGANEQDLEDRTRLTLVRVDLSTDPPTLHNLGFLRNSYVLMQPAVPFPGYQAYRASYRRSWGGFTTGAVAVSWKRFGVCYFDWTGKVAAAHSLDAKRLRVDARERERVLKEEMGTSGHVPFQKATAEELYGDHWPLEGPLYVDVVSDRDGTTWAFRRTQNDGRMVDVYGPSGYRGSFAPEGLHLPFLLADSMAFYVDLETATIIVERINGWSTQP